MKRGHLGDEDSGEEAGGEQGEDYARVVGEVWSYRRGSGMTRDEVKQE